MYLDEPGWPLIDDFFAGLALGRSAASVRRYVRVHRRLCHFLDTADMTDGLTGERTMLLEAERRLHSSGAFWSIYGPAELLACLPLFVREAWLPEGAAETRMQISVATRLADHLTQRGLVDLASSRQHAAELGRAADLARTAVESRNAPDESARMPARFLQQPGAQW